MIPEILADENEALVNALSACNDNTRYGNEVTVVIAVQAISESQTKSHLFFLTRNMLADMQMHIKEKEKMWLLTNTVKLYSAQLKQRLTEIGEDCVSAQLAAADGSSNSTERRVRDSLATAARTRTKVTNDKVCKSGPFELRMSDWKILVSQPFTSQVIRGLVEMSEPLFSDEDEDDQSRYRSISPAKHDDKAYVLPAVYDGGLGTPSVPEEVSIRSLEPLIANTVSEIEDLHMPDDTDGIVAVVWMFSKKSGKSLFHFIAGSLDEDTDFNDEGKWISTNYVTNESLHKTINEMCEGSLSSHGVSVDKIKKLLGNGPKYLVSTSLPQLKVQDNGAMHHEFAPDSFVDVVVEPDLAVDGEMRDVYSYEHEHDGLLSVKIKEPRCPPEVKYCHEAFQYKMKKDTNKAKSNEMAMLQKQKEAACWIRGLHRADQPLRTALVATTNTFNAEDWMTEATIFILNGIYLFKPNNSKGCITKQSNKKNKGWITSVYHVRIQQPDSLQTTPFPSCNVKTQTSNLECLHPHCTVVVDVNARTPNIRITPHTTPAGHPVCVELLMHHMPPIDKDMNRCFKTVGSAKDFEAQNYIQISNSLVDQEEEDVSISQIISGSWLTVEGKDVSVKDKFSHRKLIILAVGNRENIQIPTQYMFEDALSVYQCVTKIVKSRELVEFVKQDNRGAEGVANHTYNEIPTGLFHSHGKEPVVSLRSCSIKEQKCFKRFLAEILSSNVNDKDFSGITRDDFEKFKSNIQKSDLLPYNYDRGVCKLYLPTTASPNQVTASNQLCVKFDNDAHILFYDPEKLNGPTNVEDNHIIDVFNLKIVG